MLLITERPPLRSTLFPYTTLFRSTSVRGPRSFFCVRKSSIGKLVSGSQALRFRAPPAPALRGGGPRLRGVGRGRAVDRSEEHTSELQSLRQLVCRLLLEKKKRNCN